MPCPTARKGGAHRGSGLALPGAGVHDDKSTADVRHRGPNLMIVPVPANCVFRAARARRCSPNQIQYIFRGNRALRESVCIQGTGLASGLIPEVSACNITASAVGLDPVTLSGRSCLCPGDRTSDQCRGAARRRNVREIVDLERQAKEAAIHRDAAFSERTLADDYVAISPLGQVINKADTIAARKTAQLRYDSIEFRRWWCGFTEIRQS